MQSRASVQNNETIFISTQDFAYNFLDLQDKKWIPSWHRKIYCLLSVIISDLSDSVSKLADAIDMGYPAGMPNPDQAITKGIPFYLILVDFFGDNVSGNRTKSWNKHRNTYMTNRNLPRQLLQQEFHTHFISTSPSASVTEQFHAFKTIVECVSQLFMPSDAPLLYSYLQIYT